METEGNTQVSEVGAESTVTSDVNANINNDVEAVSNWRDNLSEDLKEAPSLQDFKDINGLAKSYEHLVKMQGNSIRIPGEDASDETRQEFYTKLTQVEGVVKLPSEGNTDEMNAFLDRAGRPSSPDAYKVEGIEGLDAEALGQFKQLAHEKGMTNDQLSFALEFYNSEKQEEAKQYQDVYDKSESQLKQLWGDDYNNRLHGAKAALDMYRDTHGEAVDALINSEAGSNPAVLNMLSDLYSNMKESGSIKGVGAVQYGIAPGEAREQIAEIRANKEMMNIFYNPTHPDHNSIKSKLEGLYKVAGPR